MRGTIPCGRFEHPGVGRGPGNLQTQAVNPDLGGSLTRKGRVPRYRSKKAKRQRKAITKVKAEQDKIDGEEFGFTEGFVPCLPCEDKVYDNEIFSLKCLPSRPLTDEGAQDIPKPLSRNKSHPHPPPTKKNTSENKESISEVWLNWSM